MQTEPPDRLPVAPADHQPVPLAEIDRRHPVPWGWWDAVVIYLGWLILSGPVVLGLDAVIGTPEGEVGPAIVASLVTLVAAAAGWLAIRGASAGWPGARATVRRALGPARWSGRDLVRGVGFGVAAFLIFQIGLGTALTQLLDLLGQAPPDVQEEVQQAVRGSGRGPLIVAFAVAVLAPVGEELLFRGVLYQSLAKHLPGWPAIGLSGLAFGLTHVEPFVITVTFPLGMFLAWALRRSGSLLVPITAHAVFNLIGVVLIRVGAAA